MEKGGTETHSFIHSKSAVCPEKETGQRERKNTAKPLVVVYSYYTFSLLTQVGKVEMSGGRQKPEASWVIFPPFMTCSSSCQ